MRQLKITNKITNRDSISLNKYLAEINKEPLITADEEIELAIRIKKGDKSARDKLVKANLRFVVSVAKQYQNQGMALIDLINEGNLGLLKACEKFDETKGFKFISYAVWWIRQSIMQAIIEHSKIIKVPTNKKNIYNKISKIKNDFELKNLREPTVKELSGLVNVSEDKVLELLNINQKSLSLDAPLSSDSEETFSLLNTISGNALEPDQSLLSDSVKIQIQKVLSLLSEKERKVITLYFGLNGNATLSYEDIGLRLSLTRERVRQIKERSLARIRKASGINSLLG